MSYELNYSAFFHVLSGLSVKLRASSKIERKRTVARVKLTRPTHRVGTPAAKKTVFSRGNLFGQQSVEYRRMKEIPSEK